MAYDGELVSRPIQVSSDNRTVAREDSPTPIVDVQEASDNARWDEDEWTYENENWIYQDENWFESDQETEDEWVDEYRVQILNVLLN
ncbi:MAG: hypothetical protein H0A75_03395 [Candidatus Methanofishera endochildressiae]|uniref:Uncharacterized protein n=1 Tax=Candidatus Methanofishera endochildressiae TaxID=2738884 RepID=A0A7Z0MN93_9GAMM|nr:hypothetical protein [Candidatus Methanofishera endochildressiae]